MATYVVHWTNAEGVRETHTTQDEELAYRMEEQLCRIGCTDVWVSVCWPETA